MSHSNHNMKPRELWCPLCKEYTTSDEPDARCKNLIPNYGTCGHSLITVVYSQMTGERLTGNVKLAK